jgi:hypothetical protein
LAPSEPVKHETEIKLYIFSEKTHHKKVLHDSSYKGPHLQFKNCLIWHTLNEIQGKLISDSQQYL